MDISSLQRETQTYLKAKAGMSASYHLFDENQINAIHAAWYSGRPLLIKGEPGTGKSQLAHALSCYLDWNFITYVTHAGTEPHQLLYHVDHVGRLAKAQLAQFEFDTAKNNFSKFDSHSVIPSLVEKNYVIPGPLWWAYDVDSAQAFFESSKDYKHGYEINREKPFVVLIDEIDKADTDLPNSLLEILNNSSFIPPFYDSPLQVNPLKRPFVVITSNDYRPLPGAFLRRCVVLNLSLPDGEEGKSHLNRIVGAHRNGLLNLSEEVISRAIELVMDYRKTVPNEDYRPGISEVLDLLRVLDQHPGYRTDDQRMDAIQIMKPYFLRK